MEVLLPEHGLFEFGEHSQAPPVLLPYQQRWCADRSEVKLVEKSRRIGITWAQASDDVLIAATQGRAGMNVLYIGYNREMTREYIQTCSWWAEGFNKICGEIEEFMFEDEDPDKNISAFRVRFASGHEIVALSSRPTNLRGRQGRVVIDEAAFHDDLPGLMKAALALLMWGGQVVVISTHFGEDNHFNQLVQDSRAGRVPYSVHRYDFDDALQDGLYRRICLVRGMDWSETGEQEWRSRIINSYGDAADEELFCIPSRGSGVYLLRSTVEACMDSSSVVIRWTPPARDFVDWPDDRRYREVMDWCRAELEPILEHLPDRPSWFGEDFARVGDLTAILPIQELPGLTYCAPFLVELRDCPFTQQEQILFYIGDRLPRFSGGALDKGGNGAFLAERARQQYGKDRIEEVSFHDSWNLENWPRVKAALEDGTVTIPRDDEVLEDFRAVRRIRGVPKVPRDRRTKAKDGGNRHGDAAIALVLAMFAAHNLEGCGKVEYQSVQKRRVLSRGLW